MTIKNNYTFYLEEISIDGNLNLDCATRKSKILESTC